MEKSPLLENAVVPERVMRRLERREWALQATAIVVMLLLTAGIYSFAAFPPVKHEIWWVDETAAVRALFAIIVLFGAFVFHRQRLITRLRRQVSTQASLVAGLQTRAEILQRLAILDPLTGLYNRRFLVQHLPSEMARAQRHGYTLTVILFDINGLKAINDVHGHAAGDSVLREFAAGLRRAVRSSDMAARLGGDEFLAILPECSSVDLPRVLSRMSALSAEHRGQRIPTHFAAGWAEYQDGDSADELLERADHQLYNDKRTRQAEQQGREAKQEARQKENLTTVGRFTTGVAHEFSNLLTVIKGYAELAQESLDGASQLHVRLSEIQKAASRATSLVSQLLAFSRKQVLQPTVVDLNQLLVGMNMMLRRLVGKHIELAWNPGAEVHPVCVDPGQMEQLLMHLVANARDSAPHTRLSISTGNFDMDTDFCARHRGARPGSYAWLAVRNTGISLSQEAQKRIFEFSWTKEESAPGAGLGLHAVYGFAKQNGGYFWVESDPSQGMCVTIYLPAVPKPAGVASAHGSATEVSPPEIRGTPTVLVLEELDSLRQLLCSFLQNEGCTVLTASTGEEAVHLALEADRIDLVICEVVLPGMSGIELMECIVARHSATKVLYVSGYEEEALFYRQCLDPGAKLLVAPFTAASFSSALQELLGAKA